MRDALGLKDLTFSSGQGDGPPPPDARTRVDKSEVQVGNASTRGSTV